MSPRKTSSSSCSSADRDPHGIEKRFFRPHQELFSTALEELLNGRKESCWSWYFLPSPPYIVDGVERGSPMNRKYALRSDDQARAFLAFCRDGVDLRRNYIAIVQAIRIQLQRGLSLRDLLGPMDDSKAMSSFQLLERIGKEQKDRELYLLCRRVLELCGTECKTAPPAPTMPATKRGRPLQTLLRYFPLRKKHDKSKKAKASSKANSKSPKK